MPKTPRPTAARRTSRGWLVCVDNADYPESLDLHKLYRVLPDARAAADGFVRIVDESGEDYLYPEEYFAPVAVTPSTDRKLKDHIKDHIIAALAGRPEGMGVREIARVVKRTTRRKTVGRQIRSDP